MALQKLVDVRSACSKMICTEACGDGESDAENCKRLRTADSERLTKLPDHSRK